MTLDECDLIFDSVRAASGLAEACYALSPLFDAYEVINIELASRNDFWRARLSGPEPWATISEMAYPPPSLVGPGRLNDRRSPCFYGATRRNTALVEVEVKAGDFVQIAGFRVKLGAPIRVAVIGELLHVYKTGYLRLTGIDPDFSLSRYINELGPERGECTLYIDAFLSSKLTDPDASQNEYILSRAIASMIYRNPDIDGIIFPSVRDMHGMNLALKPHAFDAKVHPVCCIHARVSKVRQFGFVACDVLQDAESVSPDGALVWLPPQGKSIRRYFNLTKEEYEAAIRGAGNRP